MILKQKTCQKCKFSETIYSNMTFHALKQSLDQSDVTNYSIAFLNFSNFIRIIFVLDTNPVPASLS